MTDKIIYRNAWDILEELWPGTASPKILLSVSEKQLAGALVYHILVAMCRVYERYFLGNKEVPPVPGRLITHFCMSTYERSAAVLTAFGIVGPIPEARDFFQIVVEPEMVAEHVDQRSDWNRDNFAEALHVFFHFEQSGGGWSGLPPQLIQTFVLAGLLESADGKLQWSEKMTPFWCIAETPDWGDAAVFFDRACAVPPI
jgi:hypothetical protein